VGIAGVAATGEGAMDVTLNIGQFLLASESHQQMFDGQKGDILV